MRALLQMLPFGRSPGMNRRRGAPKSALIRKVVAIALLLCAGLIALRDNQQTAYAEPATVQSQPAPEPVVPLVLTLSDPALATVLSPGQFVDIYAAYGEQPPMLVASGLKVLEVHRTDGALTTTGSQFAHIVVGITTREKSLVPELLAAGSIIATVSLVNF